MIQSYILTDAFKHLYARHKPAFATLHLNNVAYMQHRYWRALSSRAVSATSRALTPDQRFFDTVTRAQGLRAARSRTGSSAA